MSTTYVNFFPSCVSLFLLLRQEHMLRAPEADVAFDNRCVIVGDSLICFQKEETFLSTLRSTQSIPTLLTCYIYFSFSSFWFHVIQLVDLVSRILRIVHNVTSTRLLVFVFRILPASSTISVKALVRRCRNSLHLCAETYIPDCPENALCMGRGCIWFLTYGQTSVTSSTTVKAVGEKTYT